MTFRWTDESIAMLKALLAQGDSYCVISQKLSARFRASISRSSVGGKVKRLGLAQETPREPRPRPKAISASILPSVKESVVPLVPAPHRPLHLNARGSVFGTEKLVIPDPHPVSSDAFTFTAGVSIMDRAPGQCRWPNDGSIWDGSFRFCGRRTSARAWGTSPCPYCDAHADRAMSRRAV